MPIQNFLDSISMQKKESNIVALLKTLDFSGKDSHKDNLRTALKEKFANSSHELTDNELNYVAAASGNMNKTPFDKISS
jgi:hypothetical protein